MLIVLLLVVIINKLLYRSFLNPVFLQSLIWLGYYWLLNTNIGMYDLYMRDVEPFLVFQLLGFSVGGFLCLLFTRTKYVQYVISVPDVSLQNAYANIQRFYPVVLVIVLYCIISLMREGESFSIADMFNIRDKLVEDDGKKYGLFGTLQSFSSIYLIIYFIAKPKYSFKYVMLILLFLWLTALLNSKGSFLFFLAPLVYILYWQKKINKTYIKT